MPGWANKDGFIHYTFAKDILNSPRVEVGNENSRSYVVGDRCIHIMSKENYQCYTKIRQLAPQLVYPATKKYLNKAPATIDAMHSRLSYFVETQDVGAPNFEECFNSARNKEETEKLEEAFKNFLIRLAVLHRNLIFIRNLSLSNLRVHLTGTDYEIRIVDLSQSTTLHKDYYYVTPVSSAEGFDLLKEHSWFRLILETFLGDYVDLTGGITNSQTLGGRWKNSLPKFIKDFLVSKDDQNTQIFSKLLECLTGMNIDVTDAQISEVYQTKAHTKFWV